MNTKNLVTQLLNKCQRYPSNDVIYQYLAGDDSVRIAACEEADAMDSFLGDQEAYLADNTSDASRVKSAGEEKFIWRAISMGISIDDRNNETLDKLFVERAEEIL